MATTDTINLRATPEQKALIDKAAKSLGKSRTEFILDTMRQESQNVLLDQRLFFLDPAGFVEVERLLDLPFEDNEALQKTLNARAPWDK